MLGAEILRRAARPGVTVLGCSQRASSPSRARRARLVDDHNRLAERLLYLAGDEPVFWRKAAVHTQTGSRGR